MKSYFYTLLFIVFSTSLFAQGSLDSRKGHFGLKSFWDKETQLYGFKKDGEIVIPAKYGYVEEFGPKGLARVRNRINGSGSEVELESGLYMFNSGLDGFIDTLDNIVIPIEFGIIGELGFGDVVEFTKGLEKQVGNSLIRTEKYGLINDKGQIILEPQYDYIKPYYTRRSDLEYPAFFSATNYTYESDGNVIWQHKKPTYIDKKGNILAPNGIYDTLIPYIEVYVLDPSSDDRELFYVEKDGKAGLINRKLKVVLPLEYDISNSEATQNKLIEIYKNKNKLE